MNKRRWMLIGWLLITLALSGLAVMPTVWAMPTQGELNFTVPTPTPPHTPTTQPPPPTSPSDPPVLPTSTSSPADPTSTQTPVAAYTVTPRPEGSTPTTSDLTPTVTQTPAGTPSAAEPTVTATPTAASPDVSATSVSSEAASGGVSPSSDAVSTEATTAEQLSEAAAPGETLLGQDESGSASWLFFGGVGLLVVGVALLLFWGRRGV